MENLDLKNIYKELSADFSKEAVQFASKQDTKKGYDQTGVGYQFVVDRLNEVVGIDGWCMHWEILKEISGEFASGRLYYDITVKMTITVLGNSKCSVGGHISGCYFDALKGAITNSLKKTASLFGVGRQAYAGQLDEDFQPSKEGVVDTRRKKPEVIPPTSLKEKKLKVVQSMLIKLKKEGYTTPQYKSLLKELFGENITSSKELNDIQLQELIDYLSSLLQDLQTEGGSEEGGGYE